MKQILQNLRDGSIEAPELPTPRTGSAELQITSRASLLSPGTERMLVEFGSASLIGKARSQPDRVLQVLEKIKADGLTPTLEAVFRRLDETAIRAIVELELNALEGRLQARGLGLTLDESAMNLLAREGFDPAFGARPVKRALRRLMEDPLALALLEGRFNEASMIKVSRDSQSDRLTFEAGARDEETA